MSKPGARGTARSLLASWTLPGSNDGGCRNIVSTWAIPPAATPAKNIGSRSHSRRRIKEWTPCLDTRFPKTRLRGVLFRARGNREDDFPLRHGPAEELDFIRGGRQRQRNRWSSANGQPVWIGPLYIHPADILGNFTLITHEILHNLRLVDPTIQTKHGIPVTPITKNIPDKLHRTAFPDFRRHHAAVIR